MIKPNMISQGCGCAGKTSIEDVAYYTLRVLQRTAPPALGGVAFRSGGLSENEATRSIEAMNKMVATRKPWPLTFSFRSTLQNECVSVWAGKQTNVKAAQDALLQKVKMNSEAQRGTFQQSEFSQKLPQVPFQVSSKIDETVGPSGLKIESKTYGA